MDTNNTPAVQPQTGLQLMKKIISGPELNNRMANILGKNAGTFLASVLDLYSSDSLLSRCNPSDVMREAMKAATLHLPVTKSLGFAYIVPYKNSPTFIIGYRGLIQLAMRTGKYKSINSGCVYEGEHVVNNRITGEVSIEGTATSDKAIGYFANFTLLNGFSKTIFWTTEQLLNFARAKSRSFNSTSSPWKTDFDAMAQKTMLRQLIGKYGPMSVEYMTAVMQEDDEAMNQTVSQDANREAFVMDNPLDVVPEANPEDKMPEPEPQAVEEFSPDAGF